MEKYQREAQQQQSGRQYLGRSWCCGMRVETYKRYQYILNKPVDVVWAMASKDDPGCDCAVNRGKILRHQANTIRARITPNKKPGDGETLTLATKSYWGDLGAKSCSVEI